MCTKVDELQHCGLTAGGLPCGLQLVGRRNRTDHHRLDMAETCEAALAD